MDHDMQSPIESNESDYGLSSPDANSKNIDSSLLDPIEIAEAVSASSLTSHPSTSIVGNFNPHPLGKDPRRADHVVKWSLENIDPDQLPPDYFALLSLVLGFAAVVFSSKIAAWLGLFFSVASIVNVQRSTMDIKQMATSAFFSVITLAIVEIGGQNASPFSLLQSVVLLLWVVHKDHPKCDE